MPFINESRALPDQKDAPADGSADAARQRRYDYPSRNADIALREYAPGAEVVIDGLVWKSAGLTLNWQQPAHKDAVIEVQSLRFHWRCRACGTADCSRTMVEQCPGCDSPVSSRKFIEPAGFRVDWARDPHADTEQVQFIEPEPVQVSARRARWEPLLDPALGRGRSSHESLVFYANSGAGRRGYRVCLACGRAEEDQGRDNPLKNHAPLWGGKSGGLSCVAVSQPMMVTAPIALGYELQTDVAELQPAMLESPEGAWALAAALREALARNLGIEAGELGLTVEKRLGAIDQATPSVFLFDKNSGGAGFATRLFDDFAGLLQEAHRILNCRNPGCERGCPSCVLVADLHQHQNSIDRRSALNCVQQLLNGLVAVPAEDMALPDARLARPVADALIRMLEHGGTATFFASEAFDVAALDREPFASVFRASDRVGSRARVALRSSVLSRLNTVERLGVRDASLRCGFDLMISDPTPARNHATLLATFEQGDLVRAWYTRDHNAPSFDVGWGIGAKFPVVEGMVASVPDRSVINLDDLLPKPTPGSRVHEIDDAGRSMLLFGAWFGKLIADELKPLGLWHPGELISLTYSDRYLRSPLTVGLAMRSLAALRKLLVDDARKIPLVVTTAPLDVGRGLSPNMLHHDWQRADDRRDVVIRLAQASGFAPEFQVTAVQHARMLAITYRTASARVYLDQGFGYWHTGGGVRFDFSINTKQQAANLEKVGAFVQGRGKSFLAVTGRSENSAKEGSATAPLQATGD